MQVSEKWRCRNGEVVEISAINSQRFFGYPVMFTAKNFGTKFHANPAGQILAGQNCEHDLVELVVEGAKLSALVGDSHESLTFGTIKPSNPKDLVGVRKAPMSTVSAVVMAEVGVAMLEGACKYGRHNYRAVGVSASVYFDGTMRHLQEWWEGTDIDADSGMSHITKAITSLVVLRDAMIRGKMTDDRPPRSDEFYTALNKLAGEIIDKHADKTPRHYTIADTL